MYVERRRDRETQRKRKRERDMVRERGRLGDLVTIST